MNSQTVYKGQPDVKILKLNVTFARKKKTIKISQFTLYMYHVNSNVNVNFKCAIDFRL